MLGYDTSDDHRPVMWVRGHPLYAAHCLVIVFVLSLLAYVIVGTPTAAEALEFLTFRSEAVLRGQVWRIATYGLVNPPSLWFAVEMVMLAWFGRETERFFGRKVFLQLYAGIYLVPPALLTLIGLARPTALPGESGAFGLFLAYATLYPDAPMLFNLLAKWVAAVLVGIFTLIAISTRDWPGILALWATVGFVYAFIRHQQGRITLPKFTVTPSRRSTPARSHTPVAAARPRDSMEEVDALLDKIAVSGIGSLTSKERAQLDAARDRLRRRESGR